jgi:hypothetical protein
MAYSAAPLAPEPLFVDAVTERRAGPADPSALSYLTAGDRDLISAMFGPQVLLGAGPAGRGRGGLVGVPEFVVILIEDRQSGRLPVGIEVTSRYLQGVWDQYPSFAGRGTISTPLTKKNLADGLYFLGRRSRGGAVDVRA